MKDALLIVLLSLAARLAAAQPVIFDGSALAPVGWSWPIHEALATSTVSSGGANQLWDLSSLSTTVIGTMSITWPDSTPLRNSFPDANFAHTFAGTSSFYNLLPDRLEVSAYNITTAGVGNDYSLNPRTLLQFPFQYQDSVADIWHVAGSIPDTAVMTYDAYGTLITPLGTFYNTIRIKEDYGDGEVDYQWYITNPLITVMIYSHAQNKYYMKRLSMVAGDAASLDASMVTVYPNPFGQKLTCKIDPAMAGHVRFVLKNSVGQVMATELLYQADNSISLPCLSNGFYCYEIWQADQLLKNGKLVMSE